MNHNAASLAATLARKAKLEGIIADVRDYGKATREAALRELRKLCRDNQLPEPGPVNGRAAA